MAAVIYTELTKDELKTCLATGTLASDIREWQSQGFDFEEILDLCNTASEARAAEKSGDAKRMAEANEKLTNPSNRTHPGISVYSRPGGERDNPKGQLPYKVRWAGTPENADTLTADEFDLLLSAPDGEYRCSRSDRSTFKVTVHTKRGEQGQIESKDFDFTTRGTMRHNLPPKVDMLREIHAQAGVASPA